MPQTLLDKAVRFQLDNTSPEQAVKEMPTEAQLKDMTMKDLRELGAEREIPGWEAINPAVRRALMLSESRGFSKEKFRKFLLREVAVSCEGRGTRCD